MTEKGILGIIEDAENVTANLEVDNDNKYST